MYDDTLHWDRKYRGAAPRFEPYPLLRQHREWFRGPGRSLDLACGTGATVLWLARQGFDAFGADASPAGLTLGATEARRLGLRIHLFAADLDRYRPPAGAFDLVTVFRYLNRNLLPGLPECLRPGGLLVYQTFNLNHHRQSGFRREFTLEPGELIHRFAALDILRTNDSDSLAEPESWLIARKA